MRKFEFPKITEAQIKAYADAAQDHNPIHLDENFAKAQGLKTVIAHGMLSMGLAAEALREWGLLKEHRLETFESRFKEKVYLGDQLSAEVEDKSVDSNGRIKIRWSILKTDTKDLVLSAEASLKPL